MLTTYVLDMEIPAFGACRSRAKRLRARFVVQCGQMRIRDTIAVKVLRRPEPAHSTTTGLHESALDSEVRLILSMRKENVQCLYDIFPGRRPACGRCVTPSPHGASRNDVSLGKSRDCVE